MSDAFWPGECRFCQAWDEADPAGKDYETDEWTV